MTHSKLTLSRKRDDNGVRTFRQSGRELRFLLIDVSGAVIDRCRVRDFPGDIQDTFNELVRIHGKSGLSYRTEELQS